MDEEIRARETAAGKEDARRTRDKKETGGGSGQKGGREKAAR